MKLETQDVAKVASLAKLSFSESELSEFTQQLGNIVSFVEQLDEVNTDSVEPLAHPLGLETVTRTDVVREGLGREAALQNSPQHDDTFFLVPPVLGRV